MAQWEEGALTKSSKKPAFYKRFLDDIKIIWTHGRAEFDKFFEILQNYHASISLKFEIHDSEINFLDTTVYKGKRFQREGILDTTSNSYINHRSTPNIPSVELSNHKF